MEKKKKEHADFQNEYSQSSNFPKETEVSKLEIKGDGDVKLSKDEKLKKKEENKTIHKIIDDLSDESE